MSDPLQVYIGIESGTSESVTPCLISAAAISRHTRHSVCCNSLAVPSLAQPGRRETIWSLLRKYPMPLVYIDYNQLVLGDVGELFGLLDVLPDFTALAPYIRKQHWVKTERHIYRIPAVAPVIMRALSGEEDEDVSSLPARWYQTGEKGRLSTEAALLSYAADELPWQQPREPLARYWHEELRHALARRVISPDCLWKNIREGHVASFYASYLDALPKSCGAAV